MAYICGMWPRSEFSRNVLKVMTGTTLAQFLPLAVAPILTRIYSPTDFGVYYLFGAFVAILTPLITGRYELAILIPKEDQKAIQVMGVSVSLATICAFVIGLLLAIGAPQVAEWIGEPAVRPWLYLLPLAILIQSWHNNFNFWHNRKKRFNQLTWAKLLISGTNAGGRVGLGLLLGGIGGLVFGTMLAWLAGALFVGYHFFTKDRAMWRSWNRAAIREQARRFAHFPRQMLWGTLFNKGAFELPPILLNALFLPAIAGFFGQMSAVIRRPLQVIGRAFEEVFKQRASEELQQLGHCRGIFFKTILRLALIGFLPFMTLYLFAPPLFEFVFSEEWREAGQYARYFAIPFFLQFIVAPISSIFYLMEYTRLYTTLEFVQLTLIIAAILYGAWIWNDPDLAVRWMAWGYGLSFFLRFGALYWMVHQTIDQTRFE